ncbi:MAG: sigma-70 family RNA polymerase sigma factor [Bacillota bacterium]|nr:sigma-70 family RNA polymerase sigma factor [Bacillota bacterium]
MDEDIRLVKAVLNGNIDSFSIIVNKYEMTILKFIYNMLRDREASEDITQEVFITVYNKLYMYNSNYKFSNWILQIARNKCIDYIRKYKRVYESNLEDVRDLASDEMSPEDSAEFKETKEKVLSFINELNEVDKQLVLLRYTQELTFYDIGEILNMSESAVKRRYYKLRDRFKEYSNVREKRCKV